MFYNSHGKIISGLNLSGKIVSVIGDSISTNGADGPYSNVPEIEIKKEDVGVTLSAYVTYYDVQKGLSINGHTFTSSEIGKEVEFTPTAADIGKKIGVANNYNNNTVKTWWEVASESLGFIPNPVCWSGSSITSHEKNNTARKCSYAWHESQIRKAGLRIPGTIDRQSPDYIIIYRGTNDMTHEPYTVLTEDYFNNENFSVPSDDFLEKGKYGFKEGLVLTVSKLRKEYPKAVIILCTLNVFKRINCDEFPTNNGINTLPQYNNAIREVADFMGCPIIEFDKCGITFENCYTEGYITDSASIPTHPGEKGHRLMGLKAVADLTAQLCQTNERGE